MNRKASTRLRRFLDELDLTNSENLLPSTHISDAYNFADIVDGDELTPSYCEVMSDDLIYLFYGRPSYRTHKINDGRKEFDWPFVFIFDTSKLPDLKRIYPFDSAAFQFNLYRDYFHPKSKIEDFELDATIDRVKQIVSAFYHSNLDYLANTSRKNFDPELGQFEITGLYHLAQSPGEQNDEITRDERSSSIELQYSQNINFSDSLLGLVLPQAYMDHQPTLDAISRWELKNIKTYDTVHNTNPDHWAGQIYPEVKNIYTDLGILTS